MASHRSVPRLWALLILPTALVVAPSSAAERLLQRQRPLVVRWGEVEVAETTLVKVAPLRHEADPLNTSAAAETARPDTSHDGEIVYPNAIGLVFKGRLREEEMQGLLDGTVRARSQATVAGTLYVAGRLEGGRHSWDQFSGRLQEAAGRLTPASYEGFLSNASNVLSAAATSEVGEFMLTFCVVRPGGQDVAGEVHRTIEKTEKGSSASTGSTTNGKGGPTCGSLREAFQGRPAIDVLTTGFTVDETLEESLDLVLESHLQQPPVALPEGTRMSRKDPPEGSTGFSSVNTKDGAAHGEIYRRDGDGSAQGREAAYVLTVDARDAALARDLPRGRSVLARWDITRRDTRLGSPPHGVSEERLSLLMGVYCTSETCAPDTEAFKSATIAKLGSSEGLLSTQQIRSAMDLSGLPADSFTVFCVPGAGREMSATYCLANICLKVLNPGPVCDDIAGALPE